MADRAPVPLIVILVSVWSLSYATPAAAQCSTITGPGMSGGGPCPQPRRFPAPPAPSPQRSGGYSGGSGDLNAAGTALGILGSMLEESETPATEERDNAAPAVDEAARREAAALRAYCERMFDQAWGLVSQASGIARDDPAGAIRLFDNARAVFQRCAAPGARDLVKARIKEAQRRMAAVADDNRVGDAQRRLGANDAYSGQSNPFGSAATAKVGPAPVVATPVLAIDPQNVLNKAKARCAYAADKPDEMKTCMQAQEALAIDQADPDIKLQCSGAGSQNAREACAVRAYVQKVQQAAANPSGQENCYFDERGRPCYPGGAGGGKAGAQTASLREQLRKRLQEQRQQDGRSGDVPDAEVDTAARLAGANPAALPAAQKATPDGGSNSAPGDWNRDDPLQNYLQSTNQVSGGRNDGTLGSPKPGMTGLTPCTDCR